MNVADQLRQQANDIDMRVFDTVILLETMTEKLHAMGNLDPENLARANAVECFVTCAMRNVELMKQHVAHMHELLKVQS
jgi:hypothetical protein